MLKTIQTLYSMIVGSRVHQPRENLNREGETRMLKVTIRYARYTLSTLATVAFGVHFN